WSEGPDCSGPFAPYSQSERREHYLSAWKELRECGTIYPCTCSRKDVAQAASAPNDSDDEPIYPGRCRPAVVGAGDLRPGGTAETPLPARAVPGGENWRFRVSDGDEVHLTDLRFGPQRM